jgi:hypothetical protein
MKHLFIFASLMLGIAVAACAQQPEPVHSSHTAADKLSPIYTDGKCHFQFKAVPGQRYSDKDYIFDPTKDDPSGWAFGIGCHAGASQDEINELLDAKQIGGKWIWGSTNKPFSPQQRFKSYNFTGKNWKGIAIAYDMTMDVVPPRQRLFGYCLIETGGPQILCGGAQVQSLGDPPSTSTLPKIMAVLKTLVFVDQPANPPTASSTAAGH